jgi:predicted nucleic acid-binding protein
MKPIVVDASVLASAFFPENHTKAAKALLLSTPVLAAPDLIYAEVGNVIWKRHRRTEITCEEAVDLLDEVTRIPLDIIPSDQMIGAALELAMRTGRSVYDCLYLALAVKLKGVLISNDSRLVNAMNGTPLKDHVSILE